MDFRIKVVTYIVRDRPEEQGRQEKEMFGDVRKGGLGHLPSNKMWRCIILTNNIQLFSYSEQTSVFTTTD